MKLLMCKKCGDIFNLTFEEKQCKCGDTKGKYVNKLKATYSGEHAIPLGFTNDTLINAICNQPLDGEGEYFKAFVIPENCDTFKKEKD